MSYVTVDVDIDLGDVVDALSKNDKVKLRDDLCHELGQPDLTPSSPLMVAIRERHARRPFGPPSMCPDPICREANR